MLFTRSGSPRSVSSGRVTSKWLQTVLGDGGHSRYRVVGLGGRMAIGERRGHLTQGHLVTWPRWRLEGKSGLACIRPTASISHARAIHVDLTRGQKALLVRIPLLHWCNWDAVDAASQSSTRVVSYCGSPELAFRSCHVEQVANIPRGGNLLLLAPAHVVQSREGSPNHLHNSPPNFPFG
jgi:hypothetical protein